jgi:hypothetical protein
MSEGKSDNWRPVNEPANKVLNEVIKEMLKKTGGDK